MHWAYPNVVNDNAFIGCGRYLSLPPGAPPLPGYRRAEPRGTDLRRLLEAAKALGQVAPLAYPMVYEHINEYVDHYQGGSLDLAFVLAVIHCERPLRLSASGLTGDLWCTGTITPVNGQFKLDPVDQEAFGVKLQRFLTPTPRQDPYRPLPFSDDQVFFVPRLNFAYSEECAAWCSAAGAPVLQLDVFARAREAPPPEGGNPRMVVVVPEDALPQLIDTLFTPSRVATSWRRPGSLALGLLLVGVIAGASFWYGRPARASLGLQVNYVYRVQGQGPPLPLMPGVELASGDQYKILFALDEQAFIYIFHRNGAGQLEPLFPRRKWGASWLNHTNPVPRGKPTLVPKDNGYLALVPSTGTEQLYFLAFRQRHDAFEAWCTDFEQAQQQGNTVHEVQVREALQHALATHVARATKRHATPTERTVLVHWSDAEEELRIAEQRVEGLCPTCVYLVEFVHRSP